MALGTSGLEKFLTILYVTGGERHCVNSSSKKNQKKNQKKNNSPLRHHCDVIGGGREGDVSMGKDIRTTIRTSDEWEGDLLRNKEHYGFAQANG